MPTTTTDSTTSTLDEPPLALPLPSRYEFHRRAGQWVDYVDHRSNSLALCPILREWFEWRDGTAHPLASRRDTPALRVSPNVERTLRWVPSEEAYLPRAETAWDSIRQRGIRLRDAVPLHGQGHSRTCFYHADDAHLVCEPADRPGESWVRSHCQLIDGTYYTPEWDTFICSDCESRRPNSQDSGNGICDRCEDTFICDECNTRCSDDQYGSDGVCESCESRSGEDGDDDCILDYSDLSATTFRSETRDKLRFGRAMEMEVVEGGNCSSNARAVRWAFPSRYAVTKSDGSLNNGFEIVTRPDSLEVHRKILTASVPNFPDDLRAWDERPTPGCRQDDDGDEQEETCGMHIHTSRAAMSDLQQGKILVFVNHPANTNFIRQVAGRDSGQWAERIPKKFGDLKNGDGRRYSAVNITSQTLEFRIFRGTQVLNTMLRNLEFVAALVAFCAPAKHGVADSASATSFHKFVGKNRKTYPVLEKWLIGMAYLPERPAKKAAKV